MQHQVKIFDEDYERLRSRYGSSWAGNARRLLTQALDVLDEDRPKTGGPQAHRRFGWYVGILPGGPNGWSAQTVVYATEDTKRAAITRWYEIRHNFSAYADREVDFSGFTTHRGEDIQLFKKPEGVV